jgi:hypothetical protein
MRSLELMPDETGRCGPWGTWQPQSEADDNILVPLELCDTAVVERETTEHPHGGAMTRPGQDIELAREVLTAPPEYGTRYAKFGIRAGCRSASAL